MAGCCSTPEAVTYRSAQDCFAWVHGCWVLHNVYWVCLGTALCVVPCWRESAVPKRCASEGNSCSWPHACVSAISRTYSAYFAPLSGAETLYTTCLYREHAAFGVGLHAPYGGQSHTILLPATLTEHLCTYCGCRCVMLPLDRSWLSSVKGTTTLSHAVPTHPSPATSGQLG
jgi:hypothetical protein